jgi:hypothetical protein
LVLAADFFIRFSIVRNKKDEKKEAVITQANNAENELTDNTDNTDNTDDVIVEQTEEEKGETDNG